MEEAHKNFKTKIVDGQKTEFVPDGKPGIPPKNSKFSLVNYPSKLGEMPMYITAKENNGEKYPAIIYLNGGFGGIGDSKFDWDEESPKNNYQEADAFKRDDFVLAIPSVRGENANPGKYEMFYGEIEDLEEARKYVASLPYVDSNRCGCLLRLLNIFVFSLPLTYLWILLWTWFQKVGKKNMLWLRFHL